jgi:hypothetical protein
MRPDHLDAVLSQLLIEGIAIVGESPIKSSGLASIM